MKRKYMKCPQCGRRGVYYRMGSGGDVYSCRYEYRGCEFYAYARGCDEFDVAERGKLADLNPDAGINVSGLFDGV